MRRGNWIAAAIVYFAIVFAAGFMLGTLRVMVLEPQMGRASAVLAELPFMLVISFVVCRFVVKWCAVPERFLQRFAMGALALLLLIAAEIVVAMTLGAESLGTALVQMTDQANWAGLAGQALFGVMPVLILVRRARLSH